ncbi:MAG: hypothetical protein H7Y33_17405 [Cytophagales bacterium]|nr:hypothetical protein [Rhizobacter sp.]
MNTIQNPMGRRELLMKLLCAASVVGCVHVAAAAGQRNWQLHEFTRVELAAREAGAEPNQHPASLSADTLREQLGGVRLVTPQGSKPLFAADELAELTGPLSQALRAAGPGDDVLLLSSARREGGLLASPTALTARLFVQGGQLQLIVREARFDFFDAYRATQVVPRFNFGSRSAAGSVALEAVNATRHRADWLQMTAPAPAAPAAAAPTQSDDIERRLDLLKRLRDKNLISEDEYRQKRKDVLNQL